MEWCLQDEYRTRLAVAGCFPTALERSRSSGVRQFATGSGYDGLPDLGAVKAFVLGAEQTAAAYARNYGGTVKEIRKAQRVNAACQQVLDQPRAAELLEHPAMLTEIVETIAVRTAVRS